MNSQNLAAETEPVSEAYEFFRASLPTLLQSLWALSKAPAECYTSVIVQQLIEHRLALPFSVALVDSPSAIPSASVALLKLASQLQDKYQPRVNEGILAEVLAALNSTGVATLIIKGAAHGHAFYPDPALRRSSDHDILVAPECRKAAHDALCRFGFIATSASVFQSICGQASYRKKVFGKTVEIDLHWELGNNFALFQKFDFQTLLNSAVKVNFGTFRALRMNDVYCALHCAISYCSDHPTQRSYLALLDLALITLRLSEVNQLQLLALAKNTQTMGVLQFALNEAEKLFGSTLLKVSFETCCINDPLLRALECPSKGSNLWWPMSTPRPLIAKLKYLWFQAVPPNAYMHARYSSQANVLHLHFKRLIYAIKSLR